MTVAQGHPRLHSKSQTKWPAQAFSGETEQNSLIVLGWLFLFFFLQAFGIVFTPTVSFVGVKVFCVLMGLLIETSAQINPGISEESGFPSESLIQMRRHGRQLSASHSTDQGK